MLTLSSTLLARNVGNILLTRTLTTRVVIVGGGLGGLTCGLSLAKYGYNVNILERNVEDFDAKKTDHYVGLWSPALRCLDNLKVLNNLDLTFTKESGYRSVKGRILAYPSFSLNNFSRRETDKPSLAFVQECELLETLKTLAVKHGATVKFGQDGTQVTLCPQTGCGVVTTEDKTDYNADIIVAADGAHSNLRKLLHPQIELKSRGYKVMRGFSPCTKDGGRVTEESFQTWGPGTRFACVPVPRGNAWFAAISSRAEGDLELEPYFASWHQPIPELLKRTKESCGDVSCMEAVAFPQVIPGGLSRIDPHLGMPVAFLGDAAHTLDPILAQGAGVAVQEGVDLAARIHKQLGLAWLDVPNQSLSEEWLKVLEKFKKTRLKRVETMLKKYEEERGKRIGKLHTISNLAQLVGHVENRGLCQTRDLIIAGVPHALKSRIFDEIIKVSTS